MDLISYVTDNVKKVYQKIAELYQLEIEVDANDEQTVPTLRVEECQTDVLNRQARQWLFRVMKKMAADINDLVTLYNAQSLIDWDADGQPLTPLYYLAMPKSLAFNEVETVLDDDFKRAFELFARLEQYANNMRGD
mgnify:FL=1